MPAAILRHVEGVVLHLGASTLPHLSATGNSYLAATILTEDACSLTVRGASGVQKRRVGAI